MLCLAVVALGGVRAFTGPAYGRLAAVNTLSNQQEASVEGSLVRLYRESDGRWRWLRLWWLQRRLELLLATDSEAYARVATRLHLEEGVPRSVLPNVEEVQAAVLANQTFGENPAEAILLELTRWRYAERSPVPIERSQMSGIRGLLDEMKQVAFSCATTLDQKDLVLAVLRDLATPVLPSFYRLFVGGVRPRAEHGDPDWLVRAMKSVPLLRDDVNRDPPPFYAPFLTSIVAPLVFSYLVGPATINRRSDGQLGGIVVQRCKFLQESGCKGLCLHQCKLPAQQLFQDDFKVPVYVKPNFDTLECQWSWGVDPPPPDQDSSWPKGCLSNCPTRHLLFDEPRPSKRDRKGPSASWCDQ